MNIETYCCKSDLQKYINDEWRLEMSERIWLEKLRLKVGMTQEEVADKAGVKRQYYSMIENGGRTPSVKVAKKIGKILNFNWVLFFEEDGNKMMPSVFKRGD